MKRSWWNTKYGKESICAITKTRLRPGKNKYGLSYSVFLPCKHGFYRSALIGWVYTCRYDPTCPLCRNPFDPLHAFV